VQGTPNRDLCRRARTTPRDARAQRPPAGGHRGDFVERLARYVDTFRPGWSRRVQGATGAEIAELERLSGAYLALRDAIVHAESGTVFAESWEKLVFQHAALVRAKEAFPVYRWTSAAARGTTPRAAEVLTAFAAEHGFARAWFDDARHICLTRPDALV
jgi:hypothetical protein